MLGIISIDKQEV